MRIKFGIGPGSCGFRAAISSRPVSTRTTHPDTPLPSFFAPEDAPGDAASAAPPGSFPFTRGLYQDMYRKRLWTMRQYAGYASATESNRRYRYLLEQGTTGLSVAFDLPTQIGYDSDAPAARGEVGRVGVAIDSIEDMRTLLSGIPLGQVTTSMTINSTAAILLSMYLAVAEEQGASWAKVGGTVQNDILKEYIARGTHIYPPSRSLRLVTDLIAFCSEHVPRWNPISISGYHIREAGSTAAQEIAFTLANALCYVDLVLARGLDIDTFAPRLSFFFNAHNNFLEEVAKFRAARQLWAELVRERYEPRNERSCWLRFHTQTGGSTLTAQQPENNVARVAIQALAAVCGGTQSLHTNGADEALGLPTETSARVALRSQQIVAHETGVADVADPLGGSWAVEALTKRLADQARGMIEQIEALGGAAQAIEQGYQQNEIANAAWRHQLAVESKDEVIVGVNAYTQEEPDEAQFLAVDPAAEARQVERVRRVREERDTTAATAALDQLQQDAAGERNLVPRILDCVRQRATLGEISDRLRTVWGEYER